MSISPRHFAVGAVGLLVGRFDVVARGRRVGLVVRRRRGRRDVGVALVLEVRAAGRSRPSSPPGSRFATLTAGGVVPARSSGFTPLVEPLRLVDVRFAAVAAARAGDQGDDAGDDEQADQPRRRRRPRTAAAAPTCPGRPRVPAALGGAAPSLPPCDWPSCPPYPATGAAVCPLPFAAAPSPAAGPDLVEEPRQLVVEAPRAGPPLEDRVGLDQPRPRAALRAASRSR